MCFGQIRPSQTKGECVMNVCTYLRQVGGTLLQAAAVVLLAFCLNHSASAQGSNGLVQATCVDLPLTLNFSPGLGTLPQPTTLTGQTPGITCTYLTDGTVHAASITSLQGSGNLSCLVTPNISGTIQFAWDDGTISDITWTSIQISNLTLPTVPRVFILNGAVTSGKFNGDSFVISYNDIPDLNYLSCATGYPLGNGGLTQIDGIGSITFTQLQLP